MNSTNRAVRIVMLRDGPCSPDSRIMRHSNALADAGHSVTVVCKLMDGLPGDSIVEGVRYVRVPMNARFFQPRSGPFKFRAFEQFVAPTVKGIAPHVIEAHDLIALPAAVRIGAKIGARVLYDVHDLYLHQPKRRSRFAKWQGRRLEQKYIRQADAVTTVSDRMATYLEDAYGIQRPSVVLNAPIGIAATDGGQWNLRDDLNLAAETPLGVYTGILHKSRNLERLIAALASVPDLHVALVGPLDGGIAGKLQDVAAANGCSDRVHILPHVPHEVVTTYISSADFGILPYNDRCLNHDVTLPTKLFEAVFAGLPVLVSDLPALRDFVRQTGTGLVMDVLDVQSIAAALGRMARECKELRLSSAKVDELTGAFGWPAQADILLRLYDRLLADDKMPQLAA